MADYVNGVLQNDGGRSGESSTDISQLQADVTELEENVEDLQSGYSGFLGTFNRGTDPLNLQDGEYYVTVTGDTYLLSISENNAEGTDVSELIEACRVGYFINIGDANIFVLSSSNIQRAFTAGANAYYNLLGTFTETFVGTDFGNESFYVRKHRFARNNPTVGNVLRFGTHGTEWGANSIVGVSLTVARPPAETDKISGETIQFFDSLNGNFYASYEGGDWIFLGSGKHLAKNVYLADYGLDTDALTIAEIPVGHFQVNVISIHFSIGTDFDAPFPKFLSGLIEGDVFYIGTKAFNVSSVTLQTASPGGGRIFVFYRLGGLWEDTFSELTFQDSESLYCTFGNHLITETLWEGTLYRSNHDREDDELLNAGKKFSDYSMLQIEINGRMPFTFARKYWVGRNIRIDVPGQYFWLNYVSDTEFRTGGGGGNGNINMTKFLGVRERE